MDKFMGVVQNGASRIIAVIIVFVLLYWIGNKIVNWVTRRIFTHAYERSMHQKDLEKRQNTLASLMVNIWRVLVVICSLFAILQIFFTSEQLAPLFASAGIIGIAFGFGAQSLVRDFLSGVFIISENQYRVGDVIEIEGAGGTVEKIGARSTVLRDVDGNVHYFPNGMVQHVINKTMGYSKSRFEIYVVPETDIDKAISLINSTGAELAKEEKWKPKIIDAPKFDMIGDVTATAVKLIISGKTQPSDQWGVTAEMRRRILDTFESNHIKLGLAVPITQMSKKTNR